MFSAQRQKSAESPRGGMFRLNDGANVVVTFALVSSLFLLWGFCNGLIDVMDKHFQDELGLSKAQSAWVQFAHYLGYFLMAIPAGRLASRLGYKGGIIAGLLLVAAGGLWFIPATGFSNQIRSGAVSPNAAFVAFLAGVCIIATGLTFLETIANPYTTVLGERRYAATRINLAQSLNGVGWIFGPVAGSIFFYSVDATGRSTGSQTLYIPYVGIAAVVLVLAVIFYFAPVPDIKSDDEGSAPLVASSVSRTVWSHPHFVGAVLAQFFYVGAQAGIFSFFINYVTAETPAIPGAWDSAMSGFATHAGFLGNWLQGWFMTGPTGIAISNKGASNLASVGFVFFLTGRFTGAMLLKKTSAHLVLGAYALANVAATLLVYLKLGWLSVICVFLSYFFMSIMFPTIFALGIFGLGPQVKRGSSYIVMAIMGGALLPKLMGFVADRFDMSRGFFIPMVCFALVAVYGFLWPKLSKSPSLAGVLTLRH